MSLNRPNKTANFVLGLFFILWAIDLIDGLLIVEGVYLNYPHLALWSESLVFLYGPLLLLYSLIICNRRSTIEFNDVIHLLPFLFVTGLTGFFFHSLSVQSKIEVIEGLTTQKPSIQAFLLLTGIVTHFAAYVLYAKRVIKKTEINQKHYYSHSNLDWLNTLLNTLLFFIVISILLGLIRADRSNWYWDLGLPISLTLMCLFIIRLIWSALKNPILLSQHEESKKSNTTTDINQTVELAKRIEELLVEKELYLNPELNLDMLSDTLGESRRQVSIVINENLGKTFFDLINTYRIDTAKKRISENKDPKLTIQEVMYDVGYNSKSSFNTQFKIRVGLTPTQYMKSVRGTTL